MYKAPVKKIFFVYAFVASILLVPALHQQVFADGIFREEFNASLEGREAKLSIQINPPILTSASQQDAFVQFRLFDGNTNETIKFTTFVITAARGTDPDTDPIFANVFHTESGLLTLKIQPQEGPVRISAAQESFIEAYVADPGGTINIKGPLLLEGGLYHFRIEILGIDSIRELFPPDKVPVFDSWLSVGDVFNEGVKYNGQTYNTTIISYYDEVSQFNFNSDSKTFTWSMPFDWNVTRLSSTNVFVHEEVKIPKTFEGVGDANLYSGTVNGNQLIPAKLQLDPFSSQDQLILHYLLSKNDILKIAQKVPEGTREMTFTLAPATEATAQTTTELATDNGSIQIHAEWTPNPLNADTESIVKLTFADAFSGKKFDGDVNYDLRILSNDGNTVYSKSDLVAEEATDSQTIDFPQNENYRVEIQVTGITRDGQPVDTSMNGIARGIVVVPEFPVGALTIIGGIFAAIILLQRFSRLKN